MYTKQTILDLRQLIQDDIITYMDGFKPPRIISDLCQLVVDRCNDIIQSEEYAAILSPVLPGTTVRLLRGFGEDEHGCTGLYLPKGCEGILVEEDGNIGFRPNGPVFEKWCFFLNREDYEPTTQ